MLKLLSLCRIRAAEVRVVFCTVPKVAGLWSNLRAVDERVVLSREFFVDLSHVLLLGKARHHALRCRSPAVVSEIVRSHAIPHAPSFRRQALDNSIRRRMGVCLWSARPDEGKSFQISHERT